MLNTEHQNRNLKSHRLKFMISAKASATEATNTDISQHRMPPVNLYDEGKNEALIELSLSDSQSKCEQKEIH